MMRAALFSTKEDESKRYSHPLNFCLFTFALLSLPPFEVVGDVEAELAVFDFRAHVARLRVERAARSLHGHVERELLAAHEHYRVHALVYSALHEGRHHAAEE